jgi:hypothetical protein
MSGLEGLVDRIDLSVETEEDKKRFLEERRARGSREEPGDTALGDEIKAMRAKIEAEKQNGQKAA